MGAYECVITKLDIREYSVQNVPLEIRQKILEAARFAIIKNSEITGNHLSKNYFRLMNKIFGK